MSTFCMMCGKPLVPGARFCPECGAVVAAETSSSAAPAPSVAPVSSVAPTNESAPPKKSLSAWQGVLIGIGLFLSSLLVGFIGGYTGNTVVSTALAVLIVLGTSAWGAFDSVQIRIREYKTALASHPVLLFVAMILLWVVIFPWYLVVRSKIRAGCLERRERPKGLGFAILLLPVGVLVVIALVSAVLFISAGGPIKGIWEITNSQITAAAGGASTPASTVAATPSAQTAPSTPEDDKYVATVRGSVLSAPYNTTTIGKAFEATFTNWKWESKESEKGARFVEFTGRLKPDAYKERFDRHKKCIDSAEARHDSAGAVFGCSGEFGGWAGTAESRHAHTDAEIEIAASTATFRFIFDATNDMSFRVGYVDTDPWANVVGFPDDNSSQDWILGYIYK
jgi:hypothetical protein